MIERKKLFLMSASHLETASGQDFNVNVAEPKIEEFVLHLHPQQSGSGTPNVNNKRPLSGWYFPTLKIDGSTVTIPSTLNGMYNGTYNLKTGYKITEYTSANLTGSSSVTSYTKSGNSSIFWGYFGTITIYNAVYKPLYSNMFTFVEYSYNYAGVPDWSFCGASAYPNSVWFKVPTSVLPEASLAGAKAFLDANPVQMVGPRTARTEYVATALPVLTRGPHSIELIPDHSSDSYAEITYWTH